MEELFKQKFNSDSEDEEYIPTAKELEESKENKSKSKSDLKGQKSKVDAFWEKMKKKSGFAKPSINLVDNKTNNFEENEKEKDKKIEEEIRNAINNLHKQKEKAVTKEYFFAGQKFEEKKEITEKEIEKELSHNRKDGFLGKKKFLDETNELINEQQKLMIKKAKYAYELKQNDKKI